MAPIFCNDWDVVLKDEFHKPYYQTLRQFLAGAYKTHPVYPDMHHIFTALKLTSFGDTRVVILGQDPYHGEGQAHGLSFSVQPGTSIPPSLKNIYQELHADLHCPTPDHGFLVHWAKQGVLLLNTVLTVQAGLPASHRGRGWETFTDRVITCLNQRTVPIVFILWGSHAQAKERLITNANHYVLKSPHPSPLSAHRGFFGSRPFSKANAFLRQASLPEVDWCVPPLNSMTTEQMREAAQ